MNIENQLHIYFTEMDSADGSKRDNAVEYLGDILEHESYDAMLLQKIIDKLGELLDKETNDTELESILNALSNSVYSKHNLELPSDVIKAIYPRLKGSSIDHAKYILKST